MPKLRRTIVTLALALLAGGLPTAGLRAQTFRRGMTQFEAMRGVEIPTGKNYTVVVTEFLHHGQIAADGKNVVVVARNKELAPRRILQLGPGDFCRLAFQTIRGQTEYEVLYGGPGSPETSPAWTARDGLLLETREFTDCNLRSLEAVRRAFDAARPLGADYVDTVHHACNPLVLGQAPFLSHYSGYLQAPSVDVYGFWTSSEDCSFLLIDDKLVASAPGRHGPMRRARPEARGDAQLSAGWHKFDYYHAAAGPNAMMAVAWEARPAAARSQPVPIAAEAFNSQRIGHLPAGRVAMATVRPAPDFIVASGGSVPLPDDSIPLVGVLFRDVSPKPLSQEAKVRWDFGDGQTASHHDADHVYLHPGLYTVKLTLQTGSHAVEIANRILVDAAAPTHDEKQHTLDEYLSVIEGYDPRTLDAAAVRQLALVYEAKSAAALARAEDEARASELNESRMSDAARATARAKRLGADASGFRRYLARAVEVVRTALGPEGRAVGSDDDLIGLARLAAPMARDRLGDSLAASRIWQDAAGRIQNPALQAECDVEAADVAMNDLLDPALARTLLDSAAARLGPNAAGPTAVALRRIRGDYAGAKGDGPAARQAYSEAERALGATGNYTRQTARRGAHGRSTEEFLKDGQLDRAAAELRAWQQDFPTDRLDGYLSLLWARYWSARSRFDLVVTQAERLLVVNPDSPYADQLLYMAADSELKRGRRDRALATLHAIQKDYPGSPFIPQVKKAIAQIEASEKK